jgi:hypothetical protein
MGQSPGKQETEAYWNNMETAKMSSTLPMTQHLSKDVKKLISNLNTGTESESEFNLDKMLKQSKSKTQSKIINKHKISDSELSSTSPFISSERYDKIIKNKQVGGNNKNEEDEDEKESVSSKDSSEISSKSSSSKSSKSKSSKSSNGHHNNGNGNGKGKGKGKKQDNQKHHKKEKESKQKHKKITEESEHDDDDDVADLENYISSSEHAYNNRTNNKYQTSSNLNTSDINMVSDY